jgi:hypothetical protein
MSKRFPFVSVGFEEHWQSADPYTALMRADRRSFAWEWLRRHRPYREAWEKRHLSPTAFGLLVYEDPDRPTPEARPIWTGARDPRVIDSVPASRTHGSRDLLDIRTLSDVVSVEVDDQGTEHWLLSDGRWGVRLALHDGTLLGGPVLLEHRLVGLDDTVPKLEALRQLIALARQGDMPEALQPHEVRAPRWILELRTGDGLAAGASQQALARAFFGPAISEHRWRIHSASYRLRVQRLVRAAHRYVTNPFSGPWFD